MVKSTVGMLMIAGLALLWAPAARADRAAGQIGRDIVVAEGETVGDLGCIFCSVHVHGTVHGNVGVTFGNVDVDAGHKIAGNVGVIGGTVHLGDGSRVGGNVGVIGWLHEGDGATVNGSRGVIPGEILLLPVALLAGVIWLVVYLVRRSRYRPAYPPGYPRQRMSLRFRRSKQEWFGPGYLHQSKCRTPLAFSYWLHLHLAKEMRN